MNEALSFITPVHLALVPIIVGLTQVVKGIVKPISRWVPLLVLVISIALSALLGGTLFEVLISGLVIGLTACGAYSASTTVKNG